MVANDKARFNLASIPYTLSYVNLTLMAPMSSTDGAPDTAEPAETLVVVAFSFMLSNWIST